MFHTHVYISLAEEWKSYTPTRCPKHADNLYLLLVSRQDTSELDHTDFEISAEVKRIINVKVVEWRLDGDSVWNLLIP